MIKNTSIRRSRWNGMLIKNKLKTFVASVLLLATFSSDAQKIDTSKNRVVTNVKIDLPYVGSVKPRSTAEIESSNWMIGCETLDRDFADYDQYKT
ncbi:MAG: hypothetical protein WKI04_05430 [Ferruginibacter sp.]